jgi:hypothetical protein
MKNYTIFGAMIKIQYEIIKSKVKPDESENN